MFIDAPYYPVYIHKNKSTRIRPGSHSYLISAKLVIKVKEQSEKAGLKLNLQKTKIIASGPISTWHIDGETIQTVAAFILGGSIVTADGDCSHEIKRQLLLGRKVLTNLDRVLKSRDLCWQSNVSAF